MRMKKLSLIIEDLNTSPFNHWISDEFVLNDCWFELSDDAKSLEPMSRLRQEDKLDESYDEFLAARPNSKKKEEKKSEERLNTWNEFFFSNMLDKVKDAKIKYIHCKNFIHN